jgi:hypothetical protein
LGSAPVIIAPAQDGIFALRPYPLSIRSGDLVIANDAATPPAEHRLRRQLFRQATVLHSASCGDIERLLNHAVLVPISVIIGALAAFMMKDRRKNRS